ncbi:MAG: flagellar filament capping protein FliD [Bacteroidota bacterium]
MAYDALTTSGINNLVTSYKTTEQNKRITPLTTRKNYYQNITSAYSVLSSKLDSLKSVLSNLNSSSADSIYYSKTASSSNTNFISVSSTSGADEGSYSIRINQLAKNDLLLSQDLVSSDPSTTITVPGVHQFEIKTGDGTGAEFTSKVSVSFLEADFTGGVIKNSTVIQKIQQAINNDKAEVSSASVTGQSTSSGSFVFDLNGTETTINYSAGTYSEIIDNIISQLNSVSGISVEKVIDGTAFQLKVTVADSSKYVSFKNDSGTLLSELGISSNKEKAASSVLSASLFSPVSGKSQLSLTSRSSGNDYRITSISETGTNKALTALGLNLGTSRQMFVQSEGLDTAGFLYSLSQLNSKIEFNGINIERNSNSITDLVSGTNITLKSVMQPADAAVSIMVNKDVSTIKSKVQDFITKFNDIYTHIKSNLRSSGTTKALFSNDTTASSILSTLNSFAYSVLSGIPSNQINSLTKLGITFNVNTGLSLSNESTFNSAVENKLNEVIEFFSSSNGLAENMIVRIDPYLGSGGYIAKSRLNYDNTIKSLSDSITFAQNRLDKNAEVLRKRYINLQMQLAEILSYQNYFSSSSF